MASRPSLRLAKAFPTARRAFSTTPASYWAHPRPSLAGLPFDVSPEVQAAIAEGRAIVALESTLITHGLPPPHSSQLPKDCEDILRSQGVTPATIAILDGRIKVGLTTAQLDELAEKGFAAKKDGGAKLWKVGRRELGAAVVKRMDGGTTVSGTMAVAHLAGIKVFSTGGIGGVHRGAETSFDISSDLISLSDTPVAVVCAGSKSILDIGLTLEYLEAHAVPVAAYGTMDWPAFYTPTSGFKAPMQLDTALQVAQTIIMTDRLGLPNSLLLGVPIPAEFHAAGHALQEAVEQAVKESVENGVNKTGKAVTPWLLKRVSELTEGNSIVSNKALIKNNVKVGGEIALEYARLLKETAPRVSSCQPALPATPIAQPTPLSEHAPLEPPSLLVVGSLAIDITMTPKSASPLSTTAPGSVALTLGGVAGNVAGGAHSLLQGSEVQLVAPVGDDLLGNVAREGLKTRGMRSDGLVGLKKGGERTATCGILLDERGDLVGGVADMSIASDMEGAQVVERIQTSRPKLVAFDGNLSESTMSSLLKHCALENISTFFEPTSNAQSLKLLRAIQSGNTVHNPSPPSKAYVTYSTPNIHELSTLYAHLRTVEEPTSKLFGHDLWFDFINVDAGLLERRLPSWVVSEGVVVMAVQLLPIFGALFVKSGSRGVIVVQRVSGAEAVKRWKAEAGRKGTVVAASSQGPEEAVVIRHFAAKELGEKMISATGAGDNLAGAILAALVRGLRVSVPEELDLIVELGQSAACNTLRSPEAVGDHTDLRKLLPSA